MGSLCSNGGSGSGKTICKDTLEGTSGDLDVHSHRCAFNGMWNEECIRALCASSPICGGFMKSKDGSAYWPFGLSIRAYPKIGGESMECWKYERPPIATGY